MARTLGCISIDITDLPTGIFKYFSFSDLSILHASYGFTNEMAKQIIFGKECWVATEKESFGCRWEPVWFLVKRSIRLFLWTKSDKKKAHESIFLLVYLRKMINLYTGKKLKIVPFSAEYWPAPVKLTNSITLSH